MFRISELKFYEKDGELYMLLTSRMMSIILMMKSGTRAPKSSEVILVMRFCRFFCSSLPPSCNTYRSGYLC